MKDLKYDGKRDFLHEKVIKPCLQDSPELDFHFTGEVERVNAGKSRVRS
jgi:hypothetical protein